MEYFAVGQDLYDRTKKYPFRCVKRTKNPQTGSVLYFEQCGEETTLPHNHDDCEPWTGQGVPTEQQTFLEIARIVAQTGEDLDLIAQYPREVLEASWPLLDRETKKAITLLKQAQATKEAANV